MKRYSIRSVTAVMAAGVGMLMWTGVAFAKAPSTPGAESGKYLVHGVINHNSKTNFSFMLKAKGTKHGGNGDPLKSQ